MMKKTVLLVTVALMGFVSNSFAQESWSFGVKGGVNFSTVTGDYFKDPSHRTAFNVGVLAEIPVANRLSIQPEVLYSAQGYDFASIDEDNIFDIDDNIEYQLDYIQVPVLAKVYVTDGLSVQAGPSFNFNVNEEIDYSPTENGGDIELEDQVKDFEIGGAAGLEYKLNSGFFIQGRYTYGFTEVFDGSDAHNSVWQAGIGYQF
ncbi:porin family protein [uncultured Christiangramia sp.]|uniref:porin family protein n=1 Tax=uncultured Christiangramia sp. TaxID=503836 RepID=UPI00345C5CD4